MSRVKRLSGDNAILGDTRIYPMLVAPRPGFGYEISAFHCDSLQSGAYAGTDAPLWFGILNGDPDADELDDAVKEPTPELVDGATAFLNDIDGAQWWFSTMSPSAGSSGTAPKPNRPTHFTWPRPVGPLVHTQWLVVNDEIGSANWAISLFYDVVVIGMDDWTAYRTAPVIDMVNFGAVQ